MNKFSNTLYTTKFGTVYILYIYYIQQFYNIIAQLEDSTYGTVEKTPYLVMNMLISIGLDSLPQYTPHSHPEAQKVYGLTKPRAALKNKKWKIHLRESYLKTHSSLRNRYAITSKAMFNKVQRYKKRIRQKKVIKHRDPNRNYKYPIEEASDDDDDEDEQEEEEETSDEAEQQVQALKCLNDDTFQELLKPESEDEYNMDKLKAKDKIGYRWDALFKEHIQKDKNLSLEDLTGYDDETFGELHERRKHEISQKIWGQHGIARSSVKNRMTLIGFERDWKLSAYNKFIVESPQYVWDSIVCNPAMVWYIETVYMATGDEKDIDIERPWFADFGLTPNEGMGYKYIIY